MYFFNFYIFPMKWIPLLAFLALAFWTAANILIRKKGGKVQGVWRAVTVVLTLASVCCALYFTVFGRAEEPALSMPFIRTVEQIKAQPELIREMVMNALLFFPLGLSMPYAIGGKPKKAVLLTLAFALLLTCAIEWIQYRSHSGNAELSDILCNLLGAAIGSASYLLKNKFAR